MSEPLNKAGNRRGGPGKLRVSGPRSKPCAVCGLPIVKPFPSELRVVSVHGHCRGIQATRRMAFGRLDLLDQRYLAGLSPAERRAWLEGYRLGSRHTLKRFQARVRHREDTAA